MTFPLTARIGSVTGLTLRVSRRRRAARISAALVAAVVLALAGLPGTAGAGHISCGDSVSGLVTLDSDLTGCPGDGLIVSSSSTTIDLNGHVLSGVGAGAGIRMVDQSDVTITNGTIRNFEYGIWLEGGHGNRVGDAGTTLEVTGNWAGIHVSGTRSSEIAGTWVRGNSGTGITLVTRDVDGANPVDNQLRGNVVESNGGPGIAISAGAGSKLEQNRVVGNGRNGPAPGIVLAGSPNSVLRSNGVSANSGDGISLRESEKTLLFFNTVSSNRRNGVHVERSWSLTAVTNVIEASAADGILLVETGKTKLYDNVLRDNEQSGIHLLDSRQNHLFRNEAQGNLDGFSLEGKRDPSERTDNFVSTTRHNRLDRNIAAENKRFGILVMGTGNTVLGSNEVRGQGVGILLGDGSRDVLVAKNEVFENGTGILVMFAPNARVDGNHVHHNTDGIVFVGSSGYATLAHGFRVGFNVVEENERDGISIQEGTHGKGGNWTLNEISDPGGGSIPRHWIHDNRSNGNGDDGFDIRERYTALHQNTADGNGDLGIEAVRDVQDYGTNTASGNGNPRQCVNVTCSEGTPRSCYNPRSADAPVRRFCVSR